MRAWRVHELGDPSQVLSLDEVDRPTPGNGQVLVKVKAAALNFPDVLMAMGMYQEKPPLPYIPGVELCGEVVGTGQRVIGSPSGGPGAFAEYALMDEAAAFPAPEGLSDEKAASLYLTYQTGYVGLHRRANIQAGDWVLVHAGAGGVGTAAIQLAKAAGAHVVATAGGARKTEVCRELGADHVVDYTTEDFVGVVKELTDGEGADVVDDPANHALVKNYSVVGLHWGLYKKKDPAVIGRTHEELVGLVTSGAIDPLVGQVLPLDQAPRALAALADRGTVGKVVLVP